MNPSDISTKIDVIKEKIDAINEKIDKILSHFTQLTHSYPLHTPKPNVYTDCDTLICEMTTCWGCGEEIPENEKHTCYR